MGTITTLRPSTTSSGVGWTPSAGTLHGVTSDNSDATYATWGGSGSPLILGTPLDSPPAGERRHQVRLRARGEDGDAWWAVRLGSGALAAGAAAQFTSSPSTVTGSWGFGAPADGPTVLYTYVTGQSTGVKINELYLDVDTRDAPTFTPQVLDGSGTSTTTISDTAQPIIRADSIDLDDLNARQYRYWVTLNGAIVWDTGVVSGTAPNRQTSALDNGTYVAHLQVWSTLGQNTAYASDEETLIFTVSVGVVARPENPAVTPVADSPFYDIEACAPLVDDLDGGVGYIEIQRVDCPVGGYLTLPGTIGSYASTPKPEPDPVTTVLYPFAADTDGWVAEASETVQWASTPTHDAPGSLEMSKAMGFGPAALRFNDAHGALRDLSVDGDTITAWILLPAGAPGTGWVAHLELQDPGFGWVPGPEVDLVPGTWVQLSFTPDPGLMADCRSIGVEFTGVDVNATQPVYLDTVGIQGPGLPPVNLEVTITAQRSDDWRPASNQTLIAHYENVGQKSWRIYLDADGSGDPALVGRPVFQWTEDGTTNLAWEATDRIPIDATGTARLRVTFDTSVDELTFWSRETDDGEWVAFSTHMDGVATSLFDSSAPYVVGGALVSGLPLDRFTGRIYSAEVRDGVGGPVIVNPDFTNHLDGTREFTDSEGNLWTVHGSAAIYSPTHTYTVAMLGPLVSDECATWTDFTLPRTGQGATCEHEPVSCCSYYRARTVGRENGDLRISDWSDVYDDGIPAGIIVMWPDTEASLPDGWTRTTELDGRYPKSIPDAVTQPGTNGGAATHTHTLPTHVHPTSHLHTHTGNTGAGVGSLNSSNGAAGNTAVPATHVHSRGDTNTVNADSGSATPSVDTDANDMDRLEVVFAESDGTPVGVPDGALALTADIALSGWTDYAAAADRFLKGTSGGTGGTQEAGSLESHQHALGAHTHTGAAAHGHTAVTNALASTLSLFAGAQAVLWQTTHQHTITAANASPAALNSASGGDSGTAVPSVLLPPYRNLRVKENTSGQVSLPVGLICLWRGSIGSVPDNWQLCDGTNGTPDMFGRYPRGATTGIGDTGGSLDPHTHSSPAHSHTTGTHTHTETVASSGAATSLVSATVTVAVSTGTHTHTSGGTNTATPTVSSSTSGTLASTTSEPLHQEVAFIQMMEEPVPPADPDVFCLTWDEDEHLIRTLGPEGPIWAPVLGKFEWTVDRPFTAATGVNGSRFVTSAAPGGRNLSMTAAVESEAELARLRAVLARPLVLISPSDASEVWAAPVQESVRIIKVGRIRQITASFVGTGPQPPPQLADVGV